LWSCHTAENNPRYYERETGSSKMARQISMVKYASLFFDFIYLLY